MSARRPIAEELDVNIKGCFNGLLYAAQANEGIDWLWTKALLDNAAVPSLGL